MAVAQPVPVARARRGAFSDAVEVMQELAKHREMITARFGLAADAAHHGMQCIHRAGSYKVSYGQPVHLSSSPGLSRRSRPNRQGRAPGIGMAGTSPAMTNEAARRDANVPRVSY